jgi:transcriptional regulator with XRE-family HTH domain
MNRHDLESSGLSTSLGGDPLAERNRLVTDDGMIELGKRVETYRKKAGILQTELAEKLAVTQPMISRMERGEIRLNGELIVRLAAIFGVTTDELLGAKIKPNSDIAIARRWVKRIKRIDELPKRQQDALALIIDAFLEKPKAKAAS